MGFLSSLFDFGDKPTTKTSNIVPQYPEELKPNIQEIVDASKTIYDQRLGEGYQPYTGQTIAGFTPEEVASQEGLKSLVGTQAPLQQEALDIARGTDRQFTPEAAQQYMSPYLRTALDAQKAESQRQYERSQRPQFEADAVAAGGMSGLGTRAAVESAEREVGQQRLLANIEAVGQQKAFESAQKAFQDQTSRERQAAAQISTAAPNIFKSGIAEQGLLQTMGEQKRDLAQSTLDEAYLKYVEQQQFPEQQLARYQSSIYGNPLLKQPSYNTTGTSTGGGPGLGKVLLGLGTTALGFGTGGKSTIGGDLFKSFKAGGGIGSTMKAQEYMNRNMGGQVMPPIVYQQEGSFRNKIIDGLPGFLQNILRDDGEASDVASGPRNLDVVETEAIINDGELSYKDSLMSPSYLVEKYAGKPIFKKRKNINDGDETEDPQPISSTISDLLEDLNKGINKKFKKPIEVNNKSSLTASERFGVTSEQGTDDTQASVPRLLLAENPENLDGDDTEAVNNLNLSSPLSKILQGSRDEKGNLSLDRINKKYLALTGQEPQDGKEDKPKTVKKKKDAEPVKVGTSGKYPKNPDLADNEQGSDLASLEKIGKVKAVNTETKTVAKIAKIVQEQSGSDGIATIRKALETYNKEVRAFIDKDPYRQQKFWATIGAAIMQPGNAFANMAKGFKQAVDGLDASDKKKNELLMALTGKRFDTEVAVGGIQEKRGSSLKDRINKLNIAIAGAKGKELAALLKARASLLKGKRESINKTNLKLLGKSNDDLYKIVKGKLQTFSGKNRKILENRLKNFGEEGGLFNALNPMTSPNESVGNYFRARLGEGISVTKILKEILKLKAAS